jgi:hypothetical protein
MGGSGGGLRISPSALAELESKAKTILREGDKPRKNLFISFAHEDIDEVNLLRGQAKNASSDLEFNDWSLREPFDSDRAEYIKSGIRERIRQSSVTLVYVSEITHESKWVDWEIRETLRMGKRVIAMYKGDQAPRKLPTALTDNGIRPVPWTHAALMATLSDD